MEPGSDLLIVCPDCDGKGTVEEDSISPVDNTDIDVHIFACIPCGGSGKVQSDEGPTDYSDTWLSWPCIPHQHRQPPEAPWKPGDYLKCYECWHTYVTEQDLIDEYNKMNAEMITFDIEGEQVFHELPELTDAKLIKFCPLCAHDF